MNLNDKLDIILITYNRKELLKETFEQIFAPDSPIKDFDITILDNRSTDGTRELISEYKEKYSNIKYVVNKINIGGCANIAKALVEIPTKEYVWVLCDNDMYNWSSWREIEQAISDNYDVILTKNCKNTPANIFYEAAFVPACIYKTSNITDTVAENIYDGIKTLFPHLALIAQNINDNKKIYSVTKDIVIVGKNPNQDMSYIRGNKAEDLPPSRRFIFWSVGYFSALELIKNKKIQSEIIDNTKHYRKSLFELFQSVVVKNELYHGRYLFNYIQIFRILNFRQKLKFILAYLSIKLSFKNYSFYEMSSESEWKKYFNMVGEQKYIDNLAKKLKGKKVLLYGAGLIAKILFDNYNLSKLNIVGISDKKFEKSGEKLYCNIPVINPNELKNYEFDAVLFTLKLYKKIDRSLKNSGVKQKTYSLIKKSNHYAVRA